MTDASQAQFNDTDLTLQLAANSMGVTLDTLPSEVIEVARSR